MKAAEKEPSRWNVWSEKAWNYFQQDWSRWATLFAVCGAVVLWGAMRWWSWAYPRLVEHPDFQLRVEAIEITPPPEWVPGDLKAEVLRDAGLPNPVSLLDPDLTRRVSHAFALHPWVRHARVSKSPNSIRVRIEYRQPLMLVEVGSRLEPVDVDGVLLPAPLMSEAQRNLLPRLSGLGTSPAGPAGTSWGDQRVAAAASIAQLLAADWVKLGLHSIEPAASSLSESSEAEIYYLFSVSRQTRVIWGRAVSQPSVEEPTPQEKLSRLREFMASHHSSARPESPQDLDLRPVKHLLVVPRITHSPGVEAFR